MLDYRFYLAIVPLLLLLGWASGRTLERMHLRRLDRREREFSSILVTDLKSFPGDVDPSVPPAYVSGTAVIATDYFKSFLAGLRRIFGGELNSFRSLMIRARRASTIRMIEEAHRLGYNAVCNVRYDTADIGGMTGIKGSVMVESFVVGTAYRRDPTSLA